MSAVRICITHKPRDREVDFHWAMELPHELGEVVPNPADRNPTTGVRVMQRTGPAPCRGADRTRSRAAGPDTSAAGLLAALREIGYSIHA